jgi:hypothetical protein
VLDRGAGQVQAMRRATRNEGPFGGLEPLAGPHRPDWLVVGCAPVVGGL